MTYKLTNSDSILIDWPIPTQQLHDGDSKPELDAQVASGDYFSLLATQLDSVSKSLEATHQSDYVLLESAIADLLYLQQSYVIRKVHGSR